MGKYGSPQVGIFAKGNEDYDRPDLNKCPDCGVYFSSDICPICKKVCPEEMRAGNRESKSIRNNKSNRLKKKIISIFIIVIALFVFGVVLLGGVCGWINGDIESIVNGNAEMTKNNDQTVSWPKETGGSSIESSNPIGSTTKFSKESYNSGLGYEELYRYPGMHKGEKVKIFGYVYLVVDGDPNIAIITAENRPFDLICITYTDKATGSRLMSGDIITVYGKGNGLFENEYMTLPWISADLIEIESEKGENEEKNSEEVKEQVIEFSFGDTIEIGDWQVTLKKYTRQKEVNYDGTISNTLYVAAKNIGTEDNKVGWDLSFSIIYDGKYKYTPNASMGMSDIVPALGTSDGYYYFYIPEEACNSDMDVDIVINYENEEGKDVTYKAKYIKK
ncbi:MAG: hypothetical protein IJF49_08440 [Clostridia bacterium]|nr:hypothetical protein [Clostridia bacterium]